MALPLATAATGAAKRFDTEYYVEGFATTFDTPYLLYEYEGMQFFEVVDRNALDGADLSDVIMQYDHAGMVYARNKMARSKPPSLLIEPQESGLFIAANLGLTEEARKLYSTINEGLIYKMSWAFRVSFRTSGERDLKRARSRRRSPSCRFRASFTSSRGSGSSGR